MTTLAHHAPKQSPDPEARLAERTRRLRRIMLAVTIVGHTAVILFLAYLPFTLLIHAESGGGRLVGASFMLMLLAFFLLRLLWSRVPRLQAAIISGVLLVAGLSCLGVASAIAPTGILPDGNFSVHYSGDATFNSGALSNLVPEIDQLKLGSYLLPYTDPVIDREQSVRVRRLFLETYLDMRSDAAFVQAGSALGMCYDDAIWGKRTTLHFYQYVPKQLGRESYPVLIFLHGAMGNFKGYTWVLKELADAHGYAIISPTYGAGMWRHDSDSVVLREIHQHIAAEPILDEGAVYLAGLSNGGMGVTRGAVNFGARYKGFVFISPVIELAMIMSPGFAEGRAHKPVLVIHGEEDRRIPADSVRASAEILVSRGLPVTTRYYEGEDHFLFFSQRAAVLRDLSTWLADCASRQAE